MRYTVSWAARGNLFLGLVMVAAGLWQIIAEIPARGFWIGLVGGFALGSGVVMAIVDRRGQGAGREKVS